MRLFAMIVVAGSLAACTGEPPRPQTHGLDQNRNWPPQSREPGLSISGHADIGVVKTF